MKLTIINAKTDLGVMVDGSDKGPEIISEHFKNNDKINKIITIDKPNAIKSKDKNDLEKNIDAVNIFNEDLYHTVLEVKSNNDFPIVLGGDHSLAIGSALASIKKEGKLGMIWIDSHGDYNTFETTRTGNLHGLPLACLNHQTKDRLSFFHNGNYYDPKNTIIVGGRDIDPWEMPNIKDAGVTLFTTEDIRDQGIENIIKKAMNIALKNTNGVHISYDLDVIDPQIAPGVSVPAINGITEDEAYKIADEVLKYIDHIKSIDIVEFNPTRDINHKTENIAINILDKVIKSKDI